MSRKAALIGMAAQYIDLELDLLPKSGKVANPIAGNDSPLCSIRSFCSFKDDNETDEILDFFFDDLYLILSLRSPAGGTKI